MGAFEDGAGSGIMRIVENRWVSLVCGMFIMAVSGTQYIFSVYSQDLKSTMGYSQTQINLVGTFGNFGVYLGFLPGLLLDFAGARWTCLVSAILMFSGYFLMFLAANGTIPNVPFYVLALFMIIQGNGSAGSYTSALAGNITKFAAAHKGKIVGALVFFFGLSSAIFTQLYHWFFGGDPADLFLFLAISLAAVTSTGILFLAPPPPTHKDSVDEIAEDVFGDKELAVSGTSENVKASARFYNRELNSLQMMATVEFWLVVLSFFLGAGGGLTVINNIGGMTQALGGSDQDNLVITISLSNAFGRIVSGTIADTFARWISRPVVLSANVFLIGCAACYLAFVTDPVMLYPGAILMGLAYGGMFCMTPYLTHVLFGEKNFGANNNIMGLCPAAASLVFATGVAGVLYDQHAESGEESSEQTCLGSECYRYSLLIVAAGGVLGCLAAAVLAWWLSEWRARRSTEEALLSPREGSIQD